MKRTMKKYVSFLLAMLMLLTSVGFSAFAQSTHVHSIDTNNPTYYKVIDPTCDKAGYTIYYCTVCSKPDEGVFVEANTGNYTGVLGHTYDAGYYRPNEDDAYEKFFTCTRKYKNAEGKIVTCAHETVETEGGNDVVYYTVNFKNNRVPEHYVVDRNGVNLISTYKTEDLGTCFVKSGGTIDYDVTNPSLGKTKAFAQHRFIGWTENPDLAISRNYEAGTVISFDNVKGNMTLYPVFEGIEVSYDVTFYSLSQQLTNTQKVKHGESPKYSYPDGTLYPNPEKDADIVNFYEFKGWAARPGVTSTIPMEQIEIIPVFDRTAYYPVYSPVPKNYTVQFCKYDNTLIKAFDGIHLETNMLANKEINALATSDITAYKPSTATFNYEWTGKWRILLPNGKLGDVVDLRHFTISDLDYAEAIDTDGNTVYLENGEVKKIIRLVPEYYERLVVYNVGIVMSIPAGEDSDYYRGGADVRIFDFNNQLVAVGKTDKNGVYKCTLNYKENKPYTVKIVTSDSKYLGESLMSASFQKDPKGDAEREAMVLNVCNVSMSRNPEYESHCSCIHHNALLQPIFVRILNILYTFFNVRYECCYDMYSTIGPLLEYTQA